MPLFTSNEPTRFSHIWYCSSSDDLYLPTSCTEHIIYTHIDVCLALVRPQLFPGSGRWLDIFTVALIQLAEEKWYVSTLELQLASFEVLVAFRGVRTLRVTVARNMPLSLWGDDDPSGTTIEAREKRRLPPLRAAGVEWKMPSGMLVPLLSQAALLREAEWMKLTGIECETLESNASAVSHWGDLSQSVTRLVHSPRSYFEAVLTFLEGEENSESKKVQNWVDGGVPGFDTIQNMGSVSWPSSLRRLSIGCVLGGILDLDALPKSLKQLVVGCYFNQPVESVAWPVGLERLTLGGHFDQPIEDVAWPPRLLQLKLGDKFNQPIYDVAWPESLLRLTFGDKFDQPITDVVWPDSLQDLDFGDVFNRPIADVTWPASLLRLTFKINFDQSITDVVWPSSLLTLAFGRRFNQDITGVAWPASLRKLTFGRGFNKCIAGVFWPSSLQQLEFGNLDQSIAGVVWPSSLQSLALKGNFSQPVSKVVWPASLVRLEFGNRFNFPINKVVWPSRLQDLAFGRDFDQPLHGSVWPASLRSVTFSERFLNRSAVSDLPPFANLIGSDMSLEHYGKFEHPPVLDAFDNPTIAWVQHLFCV